MRIIPLLVLLIGAAVGCEGQQSNDAPLTVDASDGEDSPVRLQYELYTVAFESEQTTVGGMRVPITVQQIGELHLPTGKIVALDPLTMTYTAPFANAVEPGEYPVDIVVASLEQGERVALARIRFAEKTPVGWEMALIPGEELSQLEPGQFFGYIPDSSLGSFMDDAVCQHVCKIEEDFGDAWDAYQARVNASIDDAKGAIVSVADANIAVFWAGFADGSYPSYWGYDETRSPVCLVTDFGVLESH